MTRDRVVHPNLREQIKNKQIYTWQQDFRIDQYHIHDIYKALIPGEIPKLNLPLKSIPSPKPKPISSAESLSIKTKTKTLFFPNLAHNTVT